MKKLIYFLTIFLFFNETILSKEYLVEAQGKRSLLKSHNYSKTDNLKSFVLEGTFKDNAGNFGEYNGIVYVNIINNKLVKLEASNEFNYNDNVRAYNIARRDNNELMQGVGNWIYTYATNDINAIINSLCIYSISYYKDNFLTVAKCDVSDEAFEQIRSIKK